jgi:PAS domain S-box-containing protein
MSAPHRAAADTAEAHSRSIVQHLSDAIALLDAAGQITFANHACETLTGLYGDDLAGQSLLRFVHPPDVPAAVEALSRSTAHPDLPCTVDLRCQRTDGRPSFRRATFFNGLADPAIGGVLVTLADNSDRKRVEQSLLDSEERYRYLFDSSPVPMCIHEIETHRFLAVNAAFVEQYGYGRDELLAMGVQDLLPPDALTSFGDRQTRTGAHVIIDFVTRHRKKDGTIIDVEVTSHVLVFAGRGARLSQVTDITERTQARESLERSEARYRALVESLPDGVFNLDPEGRMTAVNEAMCRRLNRPASEVIGRTAAELGVPAKAVEEWRARHRRVLAGEAVDGETTTMMPDGRVHTFRAMLRPLRDPDRRIIGIAGISYDVTAQRELEAQFRQAQKMEAIGRLAGGVAHDFNNLLTAIVGYTELLKERFREGDPGLADLGEIRGAADRAAQLTRQLLAFSRKQVLQLEVLDLNAVVKNVEQMLRRLIGADIEFVAACSPDLGAAKADAGQIEQILLNLAVNARDAMPNGGKLVIETKDVELDETYTRRHAGMRPGRYVMLAVSDTGYGMTEEVKSHLFEPFYTTKERGKGTGLGLATVYGIVKQSEGYVSVYSEVGHGTAIKIYLPRLAERAAAAARPSAPVQTAAGSGTILLVEDQDSVRDLAAAVLGRRGYHVLTAENGQKALEFYARGAVPIDLLVTDIIMPGMSGLDLVKRLRPAHAELKVLYISGYNEEAVIQHGVLEPGATFLQKPFTPDVFVQAVADTLGAERSHM